MIVLSLFAHTSHRLQPLEMGVFALFKSYLQSKIHAHYSAVGVLEFFEGANCIRIAYERSLIPPNIRGGFNKTGIWAKSKNRPCIAQFVVLFSGSEN